ncbi:MAG: hypothetical protein KDD53_08280 [Bdellovibrionales bacterium]|nr:hypothetical protein [Bdellovibrionales bacterium]
MVLWSKTENLSGKSRREDTGDYMRQGFFVLFSSIAAFVIDQQFLENIVSSLFGDMLPLMLFRIILFPVVLLVGAKILGPSRSKQIKKIPTLRKK